MSIPIIVEVPSAAGPVGARLQRRDTGRWLDPADLSGRTWRDTVPIALWPLDAITSRYDPAETDVLVVAKVRDFEGTPGQGGRYVTREITSTLGDAPAYPTLRAGSIPTPADAWGDGPIDVLIVVHHSLTLADGSTNPHANGWVDWALATVEPRAERPGMRPMRGRLMLGGIPIEFTPDPEPAA